MTNLQSQSEIFKPVLGLEEYYEISTLGRIKCLRTGIIRVQGFRRGYRYIGISLPGKKRRNYAIHRMAAATFLDNPNNLPQVNHKDGNKSNNSIENLEWCTASFNGKHAYLMGLNPGTIQLVIPPVSVIATPIGTGIKHYFKSMQEASRVLHIDQALISKVANGVLEKTQGYVFTRAKVA